MVCCSFGPPSCHHLGPNFATCPDFIPYLASNLAHGHPALAQGPASFDLDQVPDFGLHRPHYLGLTPYAILLVLISIHTGPGS